MKELCLSVLFFLLLPAISFALPSHFEIVDCKFDDGTTALTDPLTGSAVCSATKGAIAINTDWFPADLTLLDPVFWNPVRHTLQFSCPTATVINVIVAGNGVTGDKTFVLNTTTALGVNEGHQFSLILSSGMTYNIQHATATQNCTVFITETYADDL